MSLRLGSSMKFVLASIELPPARIRRIRTVILNAQVGLPEIWLNDRSQGLSFISLPGYSPLGDEYNNPQHSVTNTYQIIDQATYSTGRHFLKFGGEIRLSSTERVSRYSIARLADVLRNHRQPPGRSPAGIPGRDGSSACSIIIRICGRKLMGFSFNDMWRVTPTLTLSAGVRYEYTSPGVDIRDRANLYDVTTGSLTPVGHR